MPDFSQITAKYIMNHLSACYLEMERKQRPSFQEGSTPEIVAMREKVSELRDEVMRKAVRDFYILHSQMSAFPGEIEFYHRKISLMDGGGDEYRLRPNITKLRTDRKDAEFHDYTRTKYINCTGFHYTERLGGLHNELTVWGCPLTIAVSNTRPTNLTKLLEAQSGKVNLNEYAPEFGNNAILLAVAKGWNHVDTDGKENETQGAIITTLLNEPDLNVNAIHLYNGMTPLHIACARGDDAEFINKLIKAGADINAIDIYGRKPIDLLDMTYESLQQLISTMLPSEFGERLSSGKKYPENQSHLATLPTKDKRDENIKAIRQLLFESSSDTSLQVNRAINVSTKNQGEVEDEKVIVDFIIEEHKRLRSRYSSSYWDKPDTNNTLVEIVRHANEGTEIVTGSVLGLFSTTTKFTGANTREVLLRLGVKGANLPGKKIDCNDVKVAVRDIISRLGVDSAPQKELSCK